MAYSSALGLRRYRSTTEEVGKDANWLASFRVSAAGWKSAFPGITPTVAYRWALYICLGFHILHAYSLPIVVSVDGYLYLRLAEVLGTPRFTTEWDYVRTPLFPAALRGSCEVLGFQPLAGIALGCVLGFLGVWLLASSFKQLGHPRIGAACFLLCSFYPLLVAYEHILLSDIGVFLCLVLVIRALLVDLPTWPKVLLIVVALVVGYYYRPTILYLSPLAAILLWYQSKGYPLSRRALAVLLVAVVPYLCALPWMLKLKASGRAGGVWLYGLTKQAVIPPGHPDVQFMEGAYETAIARSSSDGSFPFYGIPVEHHMPIDAVVRGRYGLHGEQFFRDRVRQFPLRYLSAVGRTFLVLSGLPGGESESYLLASSVISTNRFDAKLYDPPRSLPERFRLLAYRAFQQRTGVSWAARIEGVVTWPYRILIPISVLWSIWLAGLATWRRDWIVLTLTTIPLAFIVMHALVLQSIDRYAFPAQPILLATLCVGNARLGKGSEPR